MDSILDKFLYEKEKVIQLLEIDNKIMNDNLTYKELFNELSSCNTNFNINNDTLFVTEGNPVVVYSILNSLKLSNQKVIIFINKSYLAINKWLINSFYEIYNNSNVILDCSSNYNMYMDKNINVIPVGCEELINQVKEDFNI